MRCTPRSSYRFGVVPSFVALLVLGLVAARPSVAAEAPRLAEGDRVAICGDSITEQKIYSVFIEDYLLMCRPAASVRACQFGWSGERAPGFRDRMANDVMWFKPTAATTAYGMNDGLYKPYEEATGKAYRDATREIVRRFKANGVRLIVVGSPGCTDPAYMKMGQNPKTYNETLAKLRDVAKEVAAEEGVVFADVFGAMLSGMEKAKAKHGERLVFAGGDGFHPSDNGQLAMAYAFLKALGCDGAIGTITLDLAGGGKAEATEGHKVLSAAGGAVEVESSRYPFCFAGKADQPSARNAADALPFNEELNRFVLVVRNAGGADERLKVTWGGATKEFTAGQLEKGINLAAEFMDANPFAPAFAAVHGKVQAKQNFETPLHKDFFNRLPSFYRVVPAGEAYAPLLGAAVARQQALSDAAAAAVVPVRHTIRVEK